MSTEEGGGRSGEEPQPDRQGPARRGARKADGEQASPGGDAGAGRPESRTPAGYVCDICGSAMMERHCKILCPVCGYQRDCSDP